MKKLISFVANRSNAFVVVLSLLIFMSFIIFVLPQEAAKSEALGLTDSIDTSFYYTSSDLYRTAENYGEQGRAFYIRQRFTFDLIWPIVYTQFLFVSSVYFYKKTRLLKASWLLHVSLIAAGFDYLENIMTSVVLYRYPLMTPLISDVAGIMTMMKWSTLTAAFFILIYLTLHAAVTRIKPKYSK